MNINAAVLKYYDLFGQPCTTTTTLTLDNPQFKTTHESSPQMIILAKKCMNGMTRVGGRPQQRVLYS
jgi:hypothetical protein